MRTMLVGEGTHYEKALSWVKAEIGDNITMPDGSNFKLEKKNAKSAVCLDDAGDRICIPIKKLLPHGSDAYVSSVVRQIQDSDEIHFDTKAEEFFQDNELPSYNCSNSLSLARRLIRANRCSTDPRRDILEHLSHKLSKADAALSGEVKKNAAKLAARHLLGDFPVPMHSDTQYAAAEWIAFDSWFFRHHKTSRLIELAKNFDDILKTRIGSKIFNTVFAYRRAATAKEQCTKLSDCLHGWFMRADTPTLQKMDEAYEHLMNRIDKQTSRMAYIVMHKEVFDINTPIELVVRTLINSDASDLLQPILVYLRNVEFGYSSRSVLPTYNDLLSGRVTITDIQDAMVKREQDIENQRNQHAQDVAASVSMVAAVLETIESSHLPYINRRLRESGCKKFTKEWSSTENDYVLRLNCAGRYIQLPICHDDGLKSFMVKNFISALDANLTNAGEILTHKEMERSIDKAFVTTSEFLKTLDLGQ
ncbi:hypothetical protein I7Z51_002512 [Vibrio parahaemolyticus]|nr:hypothetical protein [Vibrio parahaemolyticus]MBO0209796.1 hypothetical protein [Vibrio sp. Vb0877]